MTCNTYMHNIHDNYAHVHVCVCGYMYISIEPRPLMAAQPISLDIPLTPIIEGFVILKKNPDYSED